MGCCISKCKPNSKPQFNSGVQGKLVISQSPPPSPPQKRKAVQSPPPSITSASFSYSTQSSTFGSCLSSASSCSSSFPKVDHHSFSNDFLQSCAIDNPQIVGLNPPKTKIEVVKQISPVSTTQKRQRASSPTLTRQKSFRVEKEGLPTRRIIRSSPSPSRQFIGYSTNYQRQPTLFSSKTHNNNEMVKTNIRASNPNRNVICKERQMYLKKKERFGYEVGSKVEVGKVLSKVNYSSGVVPMEDLDNPHIALDCFIFL